MSDLAAEVRAAWSRGGAAELHAAAERLAAGGHGRAAILAALEGVLCDVRAAGGGDAAEEGVMGVIDRLTGWCHPAGRIDAAGEG